jgi:hypothetical protein
MDQTPIYYFAALKGTCFEPPQSSKPIHTPSYELHPCFIAMAWGQSFSREEDENPCTYLRKFE